MEELDIVIMYCEDWQGIYVNGELALQDHSVRSEQLLDYLTGKTVCIKSVKYDSIEKYPYDPAWHGTLPRELSRLNEE